MKRLFGLIFALLLFFSNTTVIRGVNISAKSAVVIDAYTKRVLYEKDAYTKRGMASTTKIMTGLLAIENLNFSDVVTVSNFAASTEGSSIWLSPGEHISVEDLLYGLLLSSGNDAATALAEHASGSVEAFTLLMNQKAASLGAVNTNFTNPHGLPDNNHYTTAYDLALISANAMENTVFSEIVKTKTKAISWEGSEWNRSLTNHNKLLKLYEYSTGIKTGYTKKDGRCLVSCSEKDNRKFIIVTLSAPDDWNDHINLSEYCFSEYLPYTVFNKGEKTGVLISNNSQADALKVSAKESYVIPLRKGEEDSVKKEFSFSPAFPVKRGDVIGFCNIYFDENLIGQIELIAENDADIHKNCVDIIKQLMKGIMKQ